MLVEYINTGDSLKESGVTTNINQRVKYTSNTQSTACTATGTIYTLITGASNGSLIKTITVKATGNTTKGKIFIYSDVGGGNYTLVDEIAIDAVVKSSICPAFEVSYEVNYYVQPSATLIAWLGNAESFMITVEALDASY
ncbi:MAG: hypothetical protein JNJ41_16370 [Bacteroidia bacterium]|nr:hypothetical protein [Bacteroidia bacterium]